MPKIKKNPFLDRQGTAVQLIVDGSPFIMLGGELHNSSCSSLKYMDEKVWDKVVALNCNTVLAPIYWELMEPKEGEFDFLGMHFTPLATTCSVRA